MNNKYSLMCFLFVLVSVLTNIPNLLADTIYLKSGDKIEGKIIQQKDNFVTIDRPNDAPIVLSVHEIEGIESLQPVKVEMKDFEPFQEHYGIKYDLTPLAPEFDTANLIKALTDINLELSVNIEGVIALNTPEQDLARIVKTAVLKKDDQISEESKYVLFISPDVAREPNQIMRILKKEEKKTPEKIEKERIELLKRGEIAKIFDGGAQDPTIKNDKVLSDFAKVPGNFIGFVNDLIDGKFRKKAPIEIDDYYLSFSQLFSQAQYDNQSRDGYSVPTSGAYLLRKYYPNGSLAAEYNYLDGVLSGVSKEYGENGELKNEISFKNDQMDGPVRIYNDHGKILKEINYAQGKENGIYKEFFDNAQMHIEMKLKDSQRDEYFKEYFENGKLKYSEKYRNGKVDGLVQEFYQNGQPKFEINYELGIISGQAKEFYESGKVHFISNYSNGMKNGLVYEYSPIGNLLAEYNYSNDKLNGAFKIYDSNGEIQKQGQYNNGELTADNDVNQ